MRRTGLLLIIGVVTGLAVLGMGAVAPVPAPESAEIEQLRSEVAALHQRVASLEKQLKDAQAKPGIINPYGEPRQVPPHWKQFEFNGMPCYIVPIHQASRPAREVAKPVPHNEPKSTPTDNTDKP